MMTLISRRWNIQTKLWWFSYFSIQIEFFRSFFLARIIWCEEKSTNQIVCCLATISSISFLLRLILPKANKMMPIINGICMCIVMCNSLALTTTWITLLCKWNAKTFVLRNNKSQTEYDNYLWNMKIFFLPFRLFENQTITTNDMHSWESCEYYFE